MKILLALVLTLTGALSFAGEATGKLNIDVVSNHGSSTYLEFDERDGKITSIGNGPFSRVNNTVYLEEKADGSLVGFVFGTPFNLSCSATACVNNGSTQVAIKITQKGNQTNFDGSIQYNFVHAVVSDSELSVNADGSFDAFMRKDGIYNGQGAFNKTRYGGFDVRIAESGSLSLKDARLVVVALLHTFQASR